MMASDNKNKTLSDLFEDINMFKDYLAENIKNDDNKEFMSSMNEFRQFLKGACILSNGYLQLYDKFKEKSEYIEYRDFFMFCEGFHERLIEIEEKRIILAQDKKFSSVEQYLTLDYNKNFYKDITNEFSNLNKYMEASSNFVMVGCGSFPITLFYVMEKYKNLTVTGIDNSQEAIINAKALKTKLEYKNIIFDIIDGINFNYSHSDTIFIANLVISKTEVLKRIAMTCKQGTKIFLRVPVLYGSLLSEDVNFVSLQSFDLIDSIEPSHSTDDILYKIVVLEKK